jgi:hypothetical protein
VSEKACSMNTRTLHEPCMHADIWHVYLSLKAFLGCTLQSELLEARAKRRAGRKVVFGLLAPGTMAEDPTFLRSRLERLRNSASAFVLCQFSAPS